MKYIAYLKFVPGLNLNVTQLRIKNHYALVQEKEISIHVNILSTKIPLEKEGIKAYKITNFTLNGDPNKSQYLWDITYILKRKDCILQENEITKEYFLSFKDKILPIIEKSEIIQDLITNAL